MTNKKLAILEKCFAAEVNSAITDRISPLCQIRESKAIRELIEEGMIYEAEHTRGGRLPMKIKGYVLTHLGRLTYCESCKKASVPA